MRCISAHSNYSITVFEGREQILTDIKGYARTVQLEKPVIANFARGGLLDSEIEIALQQLPFSGVPEGVNPLTRVSIFDTEAYVQRLPRKEQEDMQVQIDLRLMELQALYPTQFVIIFPEVAEKPWGKYDENSIEDILKYQEILFFPPELVRKYEEQNKNRKEIVHAMLLAENPDFDLSSLDPQKEVVKAVRPKVVDDDEDDAPLPKTKPRSVKAGLETGFDVSA